jgi:hypothetical protein
MENELKVMIEVFEAKVSQTEEEYKKKNKGETDKEKMSKFVNRKLKKEIIFLNAVNIVPSACAINITKRFKNLLF